MASPALDVKDLAADSFGALERAAAGEDGVFDDARLSTMMQK